jgi:hypothetical protein
MRNPFKYSKTSPEIIRLAVMMYIRFPLSLQNVEDLPHERGINITHAHLFPRLTIPPPDWEGRANQKRHPIGGGISRSPSDRAKLLNALCEFESLGVDIDPSLTPLPKHVKRSLVSLCADSRERLRSRVRR